MLVESDRVTVIFRVPNTLGKKKLGEGDTNREGKGDKKGATKKVSQDVRALESFKAKIGGSSGGLFWGEYQKGVRRK